MRRLRQRYCSAGAINFEQQDEIIERKYGAIVVATGFKPDRRCDKFDEYRLQPQSTDVVTSLEFERLMNAAGPTKRHAAASLRRQASP